MTDFFTPQLNPSAPRKHLSSLHTPFGVRSVYDSVCFCNRCGSCQQDCPTYLITSQEPFSPRGRNQTVRLIMERKLSLQTNRPLLEKIAGSCLLCGRCTQACAGKIPTAEHMLELRRALGYKALPSLLHQLLALRWKKPQLFSFGVQTARLLRRLGVLRLIRLTGLFLFPGLRWISHADDILPKPLHRKEQQNLFSHLVPQTPTLVYLPSLEAQYLMPDLGNAVLKQSMQNHSVWVWNNLSSGLFEYVYGDLRQSRRLVRRLIRRHQHTENGRIPLLTDSVDVYLFLRRAPQLFEAWPRFQKQAKRFAQKVIFVTDIMSKTKQNAVSARTVKLDYSALFSREGKPFEAAQKILKTQFKKNFVECLYKDADTPAFGYGFVRHNLAKRVCMQAVRNIARTQTGTVFTLSGLSALELNFYLKRFYPQAQADHLARLNG